MVAFERRILTSLTSMKATVNDIDKKMSLLTATRGVHVDLPVELPAYGVHDFDELESWCKTDSKRTNLVSSLHSTLTLSL